MAGVYATTVQPGGPNGLRQVARQGNPLFNEALVALKDKNPYCATPPFPGLLEQIFIPDVIKVDLTTPPARLSVTPGFNRLSVFGGDVPPSTKTGGNVAGGWPNGRRFGDDVVDIAVIALGRARLLGRLRGQAPAARGR